MHYQKIQVITIVKANVPKIQENIKLLRKFPKYLRLSNFLQLCLEQKNPNKSHWR